MYATPYGVAYYTNGKEVISGLSPGSTVGNPNVKWEKTSTFNLGLDFGFFHGRLNGSLDYYVNKSSNLLIQNRILLQQVTHISIRTLRRYATAVSRLSSTLQTSVQRISHGQPTSTFRSIRTRCSSSTVVQTTITTSFRTTTLVCGSSSRKVLNSDSSTDTRLTVYTQLTTSHRTLTVHTLSKMAFLV